MNNYGPNSVVTQSNDDFVGEISADKMVQIFNNIYQSNNASLYEKREFIDAKELLNEKHDIFLFHGYFIFCVDLEDELSGNNIRIAYRDEIIKRFSSERFNEIYNNLMAFTNVFPKRTDNNPLWIIYDILKSCLVEVYKKPYDDLLKKSLEVADELKEELFEEICKMDDKKKDNCKPDLDAIQNDALVNGTIKINKDNYPSANYHLVDQINNLSKTIKILKEPKKDNESSLSYYRNRTIPALNFLSVKQVQNSTTNISETIQSEVNPVAHFFKTLIQSITNTLMSCNPFSDQLYSKYTHKYSFWKTGPTFKSTVQESQKMVRLNK